MGDRKAQIVNAVRGLREIKTVTLAGASSLYETEAVGFSEQSAFLNAVLKAEADITPQELLKELNRIEAGLGRKRKVKWGPRSIDLDILLFGGDVIETRNLKVPHPRMHVRRFTLVPMVQLAPDLTHPVLGKTMRQLLEELPEKGQGVKGV